MNWARGPRQGGSNGGAAASSTSVQVMKMVIPIKSRELLWRDEKQRWRRLVEYTGKVYNESVSSRRHTQLGHHKIIHHRRWRSVLCGRPALYGQWCRATGHPPGDEEKHRTERARPMRIRASSVLWEKEQTLDWTSSLRSQHESPAARQGSLTSLHPQHLTAQSTVVSAHKLKNCVNAPPLGDVHTLSLHPQLRFTARDRWNTHPEQSEPKGWNLHRLVRFKGLWLHPQRRFSDFSQLHSQHEQRHVGRFARRKHPHPLTRNYKAGCPCNTNKTTRSTSYPAFAE